MKNSIYTLPLLLITAIACTTIKKIKLIRAYENPTANSSAVDTTVTGITATRDGSG